jgi:hypothetical protein
MANERLAELAVEALAAALEAGMATQIAAIETEQSLTSGTIPAIVDVVRSDDPDDDRSSLIHVFDLSAESDGYDDSEWTVVCGADVSYVGDAEKESGEVMARRYATAMVKTVKANPTLTTRAVEAAVVSYRAGTAGGAGSPIRHVREIQVKVKVQDD